MHGICLASNSSTEREESGERELDAEWVSLILTAREQGISAEEIRSFLQQAAVSSKHND